MAQLRGAQPSPQILVTYVDEICNLIGDKNSAVDAFAALEVLGCGERGEGESAWPEWGKVRGAIERQSLNRRGAEARAQKAEAERAERERIEVDNAAGPDADIAARIAKLNAKLDSNVKPTQPAQASTATPSGSLRDMTADDAEDVMAFLGRLTAMSEPRRLAVISCIASCITAESCDALGRIIRVHWPMQEQRVAAEFEQLNENAYKPH
jgi:hypothetical protein